MSVQQGAVSSRLEHHATSCAESECRLCGSVCLLNRLDRRPNHLHLPFCWARWDHDQHQIRANVSSRMVHLAQHLARVPRMMISVRMVVQPRILRDDTQFETNRKTLNYHQNPSQKKCVPKLEETLTHLLLLHHQNDNCKNIKAPENLRT